MFCDLMELFRSLVEKWPENKRVDFWQNSRWRVNPKGHAGARYRVHYHDYSQLNYLILLSFLMIVRKIEKLHSVFEMILDCKMMIITSCSYSLNRNKLPISLRHFLFSLLRLEIRQKITFLREVIIFTGTSIQTN